MLVSLVVFGFGGLIKGREFGVEFGECFRGVTNSNNVSKMWGVCWVFSKNTINYDHGPT
jgi:hypothetical protein